MLFITIWRDPASHILYGTIIRNYYSMKIRHLHCVLLALALTVSVSAQSARKDFNRAQTYDVQHYKIKVDFDAKKKQVNGETTVSLKPLKAGFRSVELDAVGIQFESAVLEPTGSAMAFKTGGGKITVALDRNYSPDETVSIKFKYKANPAKGVYFVAANEGRSAQIWTQGEPDEARHWFPSFDFPSDKATTEQIITAAKDETVIGNGELLAKTDNPDGTRTWHYKMSVPHSTYLVSFVIGKYQHIAEKYKDIPVGYYIYPGKEKTARNAYGRTLDMFPVFEELTGIAYPFNKYDQTMVANFQFGGMENITATTMADTEIFFADFEFGKSAVMDLVSHELAHSWFGNMVTCKNWAELWLNEGFATFMEAAFREKAFGRENYKLKIRSDAAQFLVDDATNKRRHGLFNQRADDVSALFDNAAITYNKGGVVIHMLREQTGDAAFWKGINLYLTRHKFGSVETTDLKKAMEESSGQDLGWFFDQWVYGVGAPKIDVRKVYSASSKSLAITVTQTQTATDLVSAVFRLPLEVEITTAGRKKREKIDVNSRVQTFTIPVDGRPSAVMVDVDEKIPLKTVRDRGMAVAR
jgi:aminopeptidase N